MLGHMPNEQSTVLQLSVTREVPRSHGEVTLAESVPMLVPAGDDVLGTVCAQGSPGMQDQRGG